MNNPTIKIEEIQNAFGLITKSLLENGLSDVKLSKDYYQWIQPDGFHRVPDLDTESVTIGQISFDLERIRDINSLRFEPTTADLPALAALLMALHCQLSRF
jgi:hypothetical protein